MELQVNVWILYAGLMGTRFKGGRRLSWDGFWWTTFTGKKIRGPQRSGLPRLRSASAQVTTCSDFRDSLAFVLGVPWSASTGLRSGARRSRPSYCDHVAALRMMATRCSWLHCCMSTRRRRQLLLAVVAASYPELLL